MFEPVLYVASDTAASSIHSARYLGIMFHSMSISHHISALCKFLSQILDITLIRDRRDYKTALTITSSFIQSKRHYYNSVFQPSTFLHFNLIAFNFCEMLMLVLSPEHLNSLIFLLFSNLFTGSKLINAFILKHFF